jgi:quercetin dioxygenase-like cupin family protein
MPAASTSGPSWSAAGEGEAFWFLGTLAVIRMPGAVVGGRYSLVESLFPRGASPPLHTHPQDESYIVLEGSMTIVAGGERIELGTGAAAAVPMNLPHTFRVDSETARVLLISTPAGIEQLFVDGGVPAQAFTLPPPDTPRPAPEEMERIFASNGLQIVGPPLGPQD